MTREQTAANQAAADADVVRPLVFVFLDIELDPARLHTGIGDIAFGGNTYQGVGDFGGIDVIEETTELKSATVKMTLSGVNPIFISRALTSNYHGRQAFAWIGFLDANQALVADPDPWLDLAMDTMAIALDKESTIVLSCENEMVYWDQPAGLIYNDEDQQKLFAADLGLEFLPQLQDARIVVGGRNVTDTINTPGNRPSPDTNLRVP